MEAIAIENLTRESIPEAAGVLASGMADLPLHLAVFGPDRGVRVEILSRWFAERLAVSWCPPRCAVVGGRVRGVCVLAPPGSCRPHSIHRKRIQLNLRARASELFEPRTTEKLAQWTREWSERDPSQRHWHIGPVAVEPSHQGHGIGRALMHDILATLDHAKVCSFLETDLRRNVGFYKRLGYEVLEEIAVLEHPTWTMLRPPTANTSHDGGSYSASSHTQNAIR